MRVKLGFFFADLRLVELNCHVQRQVDTLAMLDGCWFRNT